MRLLFLKGGFNSEYSELEVTQGDFYKTIAREIYVLLKKWFKSETELSLIK